MLRRHLMGSLGTKACRAALTAVLLAGCGGGGAVATSSIPAPTSPSTTGAPSPSRSIDPASPDSVSAAGGCDEFGNCRRVEVGLWHAVSFTPSIPCASSGTTCQLHFEIYAPTSGGPWPLVVLEPGGDIAPGEPGDYLDQMATALAGQGAVVFLAQWRQSAQWAGRSPDSFADVACAIGVARRIGPAFRASPARVVLAGHSMATRPVAVVGLTPAAFAPAAGSCDATAGSLRPEAWVALAGPPNSTAGVLSDDSDPFALAAHRATAGSDLPIVLVQGGNDGGAADARAFQAALAAGGYHSRLIEIASADHFGTTVAKESIAAIPELANAK